MAYTINFQECNRKQRREFKNFKNNEVRKVINYVSTRWLSLGKYLERTLIQWDSLESYFLPNFDWMMTLLRTTQMRNLAEKGRW